MLAERARVDVALVLDGVEDFACYVRRTGLRCLAYPGRHVRTVAVDLVPVEDDISEIDADAQGQIGLGGRLGLDREGAVAGRAPPAPRRRP